MTHRKTFTALATAALFALPLSACELDTESGRNGGDEKKKPLVKVKAQKILKEFSENEAAADSKYQGKRLRVTGVVDKVDTELFDDGEYEVQVGGGSGFDIITVNCDDQSSKDVTPLKKGQQIVVVGDFEDGGDLGVELDACKIK